MAFATINIDATDLQGKLILMQSIMKPERFERAVYRIYNRTGSHVRKIMKADIPKEYAVTPTRVGKAVGRAQIMGMGCIIPVRDKRGNIGSQYKATGSARGWESLHKKYRVKAKIVNAGQSTLPERMQQGYPPFRNMPSKLGKLTFVRTGKDRGPIQKVSGIAIPQMPMNRSMDDVQRDISEWLSHQIEQEFMSFMRGH